MLKLQLPTLTLKLINWDLLVKRFEGGTSYVYQSAIKVCERLQVIKEGWGEVCK